MKRTWLKLFFLFWIASRFAFAGEEAPNEMEDQGAIIIKKAEEAIGCIGNSEKITDTVSQAAVPEEAVPWMVKAVDDRVRVGFKMQYQIARK